MGKVNFQLAYDGPALKSGAMDVNELASALLATADLFREANRDLNGEKAEASIKVRSDFKRGSFEVWLICDQSIIEQAKSLMFPATVVGAGALVALLFGTDAIKKGAVGVITSVLDLWKALHGEKPKAVIEDPEKRMTIIVMGDGNQINTSPQVAQLYADSAVRASIGATLRPVSKPGVTSLTIKKGDKTLNEVKKSDLPITTEVGMELVKTTRAGVREETREAVLLRVVRANFEKGKWGFSDGAAHFSAEIEDETFIRQLDARDIGFYKGDVLRVDLKVTQIVLPDHQFQTKYVIFKVLEYIPGLRQQPLLAAPETMLLNTTDDVMPVAPAPSKRGRRFRLPSPE